MSIRTYIDKFKKMTSRIIWIIGNVVLIVMYFYDKTHIQCEPCISSNCPPCQTEFMKYIWLYVVAWNLLYIIIEFIARKKSWTRWLKRKP